ncbi:MAG: magnesium/cobalt transporter CorA [Bacteroidia bacterium]|nr:magnesium/cobalt transporter CorA [Bacteroidia bacterium]
MTRPKNLRFKKRASRLSAKSGMPTESLVYIGKERPGSINISLIDYDGQTIEKRELDSIQECQKYKDKDSVSWISVKGVHDSEKVQEICNLYGIHPLIQEDILNTQQRTKIEEFEDYIFITFKNILHNEITKEIETEQISLLLGQNYLISFQESENKLFDEIILRIETSKGTIRNRKSDYLLYKILDTAVDQYFVNIDHIEDQLEVLEDEIMRNPNTNTSLNIQELKKQLLLMGKYILPMREVLNKLEAGTNELLEQRNLNYFRDVYDHTYQAYESIESQKSLLNDLMNLNFTLMSNRLNEVMKLLTIISTIFMPLSFLTGVFGMNFKYFPGMNHPDAIYYFWGVVGLIFISMFLYFRNKKWF